MPDEMAADNVTDADLIDETFSLETNVVEALRGKYEGPKFEALRKIGAFIGNGMSRRESCILSFVDPEQFEALIAVDRDVAKFILFKETVYKAKLMRTVTIKGTEGMSEKSAGWLLERKFREEFAKSTGDAPPRSGDLLEEGIAFVRKNGDSTPVVVPTDAKAIVVHGMPIQK